MGRLLALALATAAPALVVPAGAAADSCVQSFEGGGSTSWEFGGNFPGGVITGGRVHQPALPPGIPKTEPAYRDYGSLLVTVGAAGAVYSAPNSGACGHEDGGREVVYPPVLATVGGVTVELSRKVLVSDSSSLVRYLDLIRNPTGAPQTIGAITFGGGLATASGNPADLVVVGTSDGDTNLGAPDSWAATEDGGGGSVVARAVSVWDELGPVKADAADVAGLIGVTLRARYDNVTLAPGETAAYMHVVSLVGTQAEAIARGRELQTGSPTVFEGLSIEEGELIRNWDGTDFDRDGILNRPDNCLLVRNADQRNTDGDPAGDACDADDDDEGLSDADELATGTDPLVRDTDGDGLDDRADLCPRRAGPGDGCPGGATAALSVTGDAAFAGAAEADNTPPTVLWDLPQRVSFAELLRGFRGQVGCNERCVLRIRLLLRSPVSDAPGRASAAADPPGFNHTIARTFVPFGDGMRRVRVRTCVRRASGRRSRSCLRRTERFRPRSQSFLAVFRIEARDGAGNKRIVLRRMRVQR